MSQLVLSLEENATRGALMDALCAQLSEDQQAVCAAACDAAGVPDGHHHHLADVYATIDGLAVSDRVKDDLRGIYRILAEAEATAHGCAVDQTHFHEVGNGSGIKNALHICLLVEALDPDEIVATRVQTGEGTVMCAHGELPIPAPATAAIIARGIPTCEHTLPGERLTPTSAAIILHFVDRFETE